MDISKNQGIKKIIFLFFIMEIMIMPAQGKRPNIYGFTPENTIQKIAENYLEFVQQFQEFVKDVQYSELWGMEGPTYTSIYVNTRVGPIMIAVVLNADWSDQNPVNVSCGWFSSLGLGKIREYEKKDLTTIVNYDSDEDFINAFYYNRNERKYTGYTYNEMMLYDDGNGAGPTWTGPKGTTLNELFWWYKKGLVRFGYQQPKSVANYVNQIMAAHQMAQQSQELFNEGLIDSNVYQQFIALKPNYQFGKMEGFDLGFYDGHAYYIRKGYGIDSELTTKITKDHPGYKDYLLVYRKVEHKSDRMKQILKSAIKIATIYIAAAVGKWIGNYYAKQIGLYNGPVLAGNLNTGFRYGKPTTQALNRIRQYKNIGSWAGAQMGYMAHNTISDQVFDDHRRFLVPKRYSAAWGCYVWYDIPKTIHRRTYWNTFDWKNYYIAGSDPQKDLATPKDYMKWLDPDYKKLPQFYREIFNEYPLTPPWSEVEIQKSLELINQNPKISIQYQQWLQSQEGY